jgi:hypothetical protein
MCEKPVLQQPDFNKTFYLQTDASAYGVGAVLSQEGEGSATHKPKRHPIAYYSSTFTPTEQNYNIFEREFLGVKKALANWRPYLIWTKEPFIIETDHKNLTYWKSPRKLSGRTARWYEELQDYNFKIVHIPGKSNVPADALSHPDGEDVQRNEKEVALIPPEAFIRVFDANSEGSLESRIVQTQRLHPGAMRKLESNSLAQRVDTTLGPHWTDSKGCLVVPPDDHIRREIARDWHDHRGAGHPGRDETIRKIQR